MVLWFWLVLMQLIRLWPDSPQVLGAIEGMIESRTQRVNMWRKAQFAGAEAALRAATRAAAATCGL